MESLIELVRPNSQDTLVALGDFVDRGIDSKRVLEQLIELETRCRLVPILGNHDEMMLSSAHSRSAFDFWMNCGGQATLDSYGEQARISSIPLSHFEFLKRCLDFYETDGLFFVHANYQADQQLDQQSPKVRRWLSLEVHLPEPHMSGRTAVVGHTPQPHHRILDLGHLKCLDTGCGHGGKLTALELQSGERWQVDESGASTTGRT